MPIHGSLYYDFEPGDLTYSDFEDNSDSLKEQLLNEFNQSVKKQVETKSVKLQTVLEKYESLLNKHKIEFESNGISNKRRSIEKNLTKINKQVEKLKLQEIKEINEQFEIVHVEN